MHDTFSNPRTPGEAEDPLDAIFGPVSSATFATEYWARQALYIRGTPAKFRGLLTQSSFIRLSHAADALQATVNLPDRSGHAGIIGIAPRQIRALYAAGATICAKGLEKGSPALAALARSMKETLGYTGKVDCRSYLSGNRSGFTTHFDCRHATTLQIEGEKVWRYAEQPSYPFPPANALVSKGVASLAVADGLPRARELGLEPAIEAPPARLGMKEVTLKPGDVLYLPPGTWHSAQAVGHSLAVNMAFNYTKEGSTLELFCDLLYALLYGDPAWRGTPPLAVEADETGLPANVKAFFAERLDELRRSLESVDGDDARLAGAWRTRLRSQRTGASPKPAAEASDARIERPDRAR